MKPVKPMKHSLVGLTTYSLRSHYGVAGCSRIVPLLAILAGLSSFVVPAFAGASAEQALRRMDVNSTGAEQPMVSLSIQTDKVVRQIDEKIYGHFLEHIYHSCNGGLWGEIVWNRSFEETPNSDEWRAKGGCLETPASGPGEPRFTFGESAWRDCEFSVETRKTDGTDGLLIGVRNDRNNGYTLVLGAGGNQRHELERAANNRQTRNRDVTTARTVAGQIETGRWYRVRVRCEGQHLQAWLDDQPLFDYTDKSGPASGQVSVGARNAQAQFRNFKVATLDGKVLFDSLPALARHWQVVGAGEVSLDTNQPLNSKTSMKVVSDSGEAGVAQNRFCIRKGDWCRGSLWLRGEAPDGIVVRLLDGQRTLAEKTLSVPTVEWKEFGLELNPDTTAENATLQIVTRGKAAVWLDQVSLVPDSARAAGGLRPDLLGAVADLRPPIIRWPGGSFVGGYNWKNGIGPQHKRIEKRGWDELDPLGFGIDEFIALCRKVGAEPLVVIHVGPGNQPEKRPQYVQDACDFVEYCNGPATSKWGKVRAENGHPEPYFVKYWEIDNEIWGMKPEQYTSIVKQFVPAMKKIDPSIITIACGSGQLGGRWGDGDVAVINECADVVDYLSIHHYESPDRFADGPAAADKFWRSLGELIAKSKNPKLKLYMSEWNAQSTDWRTGLHAGGILNAFERNATMGMAGPALFLRHVSAPAWDNAFINFDQRTWFPAPNYVVMKLYRDHFASNLLEMAGDIGGLNAVATKSADGKHVYFKVVNPADKPVDVRLEIKGDFKASKVGLKLVAPDDLAARNTLDKPGVVHVADGKARREGKVVRFSLPRWSVGVVDLAK